METYHAGDFNHSDQLEKYINDARRSHPKVWVVIYARFRGKIITIKMYNTWMQIFKIDNVDYSSPMELKVGEYRQWIKESLERAVNGK